MIISWRDDIVGAKNAVYKYGSCKIAMRFARLTGEWTYNISHKAHLGEYHTDGISHYEWYTVRLYTANLLKTQFTC